MSLEDASSENEQLLRSAYEAGINFFDTADLYDKGRNEETVGRALRSIRDEVIIATKVGNQWREDGSGWDWNPRKEYILSAVDESLRRLRTDYIDLYMLHGGTIDDPIDESIEAFELLKSQGKIRAYGISSIRPNVIREWTTRSNMDCVMMQYSLLDRRPEEECLDMLHKNDISVITRGSLAKGLLIDKPSKEYMGYSAEQVRLMKEEVNESENPVSAAVRFVLNHPAVASAVVGMRTKDQLDDLLSSTSINISENVLESLGEILKPNTYDKHR
jgi:aryl-alcohol dehydrogenase-like predicted oxidoreductase